MNWKKTIIKAVKTAAVMGGALAGITLGEQAIAILKDRPEAWATGLAAVIYALLDWLKHRKDTKVLPSLPDTLPPWPTADDSPEVKEQKLAAREAALRKSIG